MNSDMKKFLRKLLLIPVVLILSLAFWFPLGSVITSNPYQKGYNASLIDKAARLKSINEPKIILVGNSNLSFGMNSQMLQDALNMPVVNLGLHGGLGNAFHENIAKLNINSGDLVIICHSDFADDDKIDNTMLAWITIEYHWDLYGILRIKDFLDMLIDYPGYWLKSLSLWNSGESGEAQDELTAYSRNSFNEFGDVVIKPAQDKSAREIYIENVEKGEIKVPEINDICVNRLNELNKYVTERGATLLVAGYPIMYGEFTPPKEDYEKFQRELASKLDCEIISDYRDYFIPYKYFYDTTLHLSETGANIRTSQLIRDIKNWQNKTGNH